MPDQPAPMLEWKHLLRECGEKGLAPEEAKLASSSSDTAIDAIVGLARLPELHDRSFRRGIVVCAAEEHDLTAVLFWRGQFFGIYRHTISVRGVHGILLDLKEFRLGWLPDEVVRETGGSGSAFADLPPEAEGFPILCVTGANADLFDGFGKIYNQY